MFFYFFKIMIFRVARGVKGQKMVQNDKKFCPPCPISHELYIIWLSFMVHMCKMIVSPGFFYIFQNFNFSGCVVRGKRAKKTVQNCKKFRLSRSISQEPYIIWLSFMVHVCKMMIFPGAFLFFQNFDFLGCWWGVAERAKNGPK